MNKFLDFLRYQFLAILWSFLIFYFSELKKVPVPKFPYSDKIIHFGIFYFLGILVARAFIFQNRIEVLKKYFFAFTIIFVFIYGVSDEVHQIYVPGRKAEIYDLIADLLGGIVAALSVKFVLKKNKKL